MNKGSNRAGEDVNKFSQSSTINTQHFCSATTLVLQTCTCSQINVLQVSKAELSVLINPNLHPTPHPIHPRCFCKEKKRTNQS